MNMLARSRNQLAGGRWRTTWSSFLGALLYIIIINMVVLSRAPHCQPGVGPLSFGVSTSPAARESVVMGPSAPTPLPDSLLYIVTPCSRMAFLSQIRRTLPDNLDWVWIIVYAWEPPTFQFLHEQDRVHEVWPGRQLESVERPKNRNTFGNPERNFAISLIQLQDSYLYFLDDDNGMHPDFWYYIYPEVAQKKYDFITFDQERIPGSIVSGESVALDVIDTAMYVSQRGAVGDARWLSTRRDADGFFAMEMEHRARRPFYMRCTCSFYNFFKENFTGPRKHLFHPFVSVSA